MKIFPPVPEFFPSDNLTQTGFVNGRKIFELQPVCDIGDLCHLCKVLFCDWLLATIAITKKQKRV